MNWPVRSTICTGLAHRLDDRAGRAEADDARLAERLVVDDADDADLDGVAERILLLDDLRRRGKHDLLAVAQHDEDDRIAGAP